MSKYSVAPMKASLGISTRKVDWGSCLRLNRLDVKRARVLRTPLCHRRFLDLQ